MTAQYTTLDRDFRNLLRCPLCKGNLNVQQVGASCPTCVSSFPAARVGFANHAELVQDFRIRSPISGARPGAHSWRRIQDGYEQYERYHSSIDSLEVYEKELDSVREVYQEKFQLSGRVLDVGGGQGRLRAYLSAEVQYICIDPFVDILAIAERQPNLRRVYPCLAQPCNFVAGAAEHLPFDAAAFDWVHLRSVLDHVEEPFYCLKEAQRVLKPGGRLMVGLAVGGHSHDHHTNRPPLRTLLKLAWARMRADGAGALYRAVRAFVSPPLGGHADEHVTEWTFAVLLSALEKTGFAAETIHWQKKPYENCVYVAAVKASAPVLRSPEPVDLAAS